MLFYRTPVGVKDPKWVFPRLVRALDGDEQESRTSGGDAYWRLEQQTIMGACSALGVHRAKRL